ncbi:glutathione S-transferase T3-like [Asparagus officinalis]|uniref:glutathione S-transferase T3-like n=1 Tax=Asparagus officinalis TaxID=4686 RepID=UPI00098E6E65|nr:glutathione S-transferase T3-like [Asparagus officinalis]
MTSNQRSSSYTNAEDSHLCHVYLDISQNPIIGINQSKDQFWSRVESDYHSSMPAFITQVRPRRSLQCRMQTLLTAIGKMRGCVRQVENLNPSGASEQDIFNRAKVLFAQDKNYKKGFKFDHVWPILKDIEKFADVNAGIQVGRMQHGNFASSQSEYSPTSESPTPASPRLASFGFNMNDNDFGGTSERPIGVRKAKFKKRNDEESSKFMEYMKEENQKMLAIMESLWSI